MSFASSLSNPIVLGGGALVGIVLLLSKGKTAPAASPSNYSPAVGGNTLAVNSAVLNAQVELAKIQADMGGNAYRADVSKTLGFFSLMRGIDDNNRIIEGQRITSQAGVANAMIASSTAIIVDQSNNAARLGMAYEETSRAQIGANRDVAVARYSYKGTKQVAKWGAISNIAGSISKAAVAFA